MSQRAVEQVVGKLLTDEQFRSWFFKDPRRSSFLYGLELSLEELAALLRIPRTGLAALSGHLDEKIRRHHVSASTAAEDEQNVPRKEART